MEVNDAFSHRIGRQDRRKPALRTWRHPNNASGVSVRQKGDPFRAVVKSTEILNQKGLVETAPSTCTQCLLQANLRGALVEQRA